jgi:hypothetical protein
VVDFRKRLGDKRTSTKPVDPSLIYENLDRASDKGPLRPAQKVILDEWHKHRRSSKDVIIKMHTGQGKTLIGLLILQAKLNEHPDRRWSPHKSPHNGDLDREMENGLSAYKRVVNRGGLEPPTRCHRPKC